MTDGPGASQCCCSSSSMEELCSFPNEEKFTAVWQHSHRPSYRVPFWEGEQGEQSPKEQLPLTTGASGALLCLLRECDKVQELFLLCDQIY